MSEIPAAITTIEEWETAFPNLRSTLYRITNISERTILLIKLSKLTKRVKEIKRIHQLDPENINRLAFQFKKLNAKYKTFRENLFLVVLQE